MIRIDRHVPIPETAPGRKGELADALRRMSFGDSVYIPAGNVHLARCRAYQVARYHNVQIVTRKVDGGLRVWRTK